MKISEFTDKQKQALMDLLVMGMYADHNLASPEDACAQRLLDSMQFPSAYERDNFSDAAFTRVSQHTGSQEAIQAHITRLAADFPTPELRREVYDKLQDLLTSDGRVTTEESQLLSAVKAAFRL